MRQDEIAKEIHKLQAQNAANNARIRKLYAQYEKPNTVPVMYPFEHGERYYTVSSRGEVVEGAYQDSSAYKAADEIGNKNHLFYPNRDYVVLLQRLMQESANLLWFKWNYDKYYIPNWEDISPKWYVVMEYTLDTSVFTVRSTISDRQSSAVYFSTEAIARKCAEWLNARLKYTGA